MSRPPQARPRTAARVAAIQALFQAEQTGENPEAVLDQFLRHRIGALPGTGGYEDGVIPEAYTPLFTSLVRGAAGRAEHLDGIVAAHLATGWPLARLDPVLRALLRCAAAELERADTPARVVINEYMDIAHGFLPDHEPRFANGVLDALARTLRPAEFTGSGAPRGAP